MFEHCEWMTKDDDDGHVHTISSTQPEIGDIDFLILVYKLCFRIR